VECRADAILEVVRRRAPAPTPDQAVATFEAMLRSQDGLRQLLALMPAGSTLEDARRLREKTMQKQRRPCSFLDRDLGIERD
jgi:hypothetical protein